MIDGMDEDRLASFVAAVWQRQGWQTKSMAEGGGKFVMVRREQPEPERGLIWVVANPDEPVAESDLTGFLNFCEKKGVDEGAVVTTGTFAPDATDFAAREGVGLLDGGELREIIPTHGLTDLAEKYGGGEGGSTDADSAELLDSLSIEPLDALSTGLLGGFGDEPLDALKSKLPASDALPVSGRVVVVALLVVAVLLAGVLVGPSLNPFGGDGGASSSDDSVTARTFSPESSETTLLVSWDATRRSVIDPNPDDDTAYYPRENRTFLLVKLQLTNAGDAAVPVRQTDFLLEMNETRYGHQPLAGTSSFDAGELVQGDTYGGWTVFSIPEDASGGTLVVDERAFARHNATVQFSRDDELDVNVSG